MSIGQRTLEWLRTELFQIDSEWVEETLNGFRWWPHQQAQTLEVIGRHTGPDGKVAELVRVRTALLQDLDLDAEALEVLQAVALRTAAMAGAVYDPTHRTLDLCSLVRVCADTQAWMQRLIGMAALLQVRDAWWGTAALAEALGAAPAHSAHPRRGSRLEADARVAEALVVIDAEGRSPSRWAGEELAHLAESDLKRSPALTGSGDARGFTAKFPYGEDSASLCEVATDQTHPWYGQGLALRQRFPVTLTTPERGWRLALELNARALGEAPMGYGFGSFGYEERTLSFHAFFPNAIQRQGLVTNLYLSCAERARMVSLLLTGVDWTAELFGPRRAAGGEGT